MDVQDWRTDAVKELQKQFTKKREKLTFSFTLEITEQKADEEGNLKKRTFDLKLHKTRSGVANVVDYIEELVAEYSKKPYVVDLKLKNLEVMEIPFHSLDAKLQLMFQDARALIIVDDLNLNPNLRETRACVPLTLYDIYAWKEGTKKTSKQLKIDQLDILIDLNPNADPEHIEDNQKHYMEKGYSCNDVLEFCETRRITMYALDHHGKLLAKHNTDCNQHLPALCFVVSNNHMYLLDKTDERQHIFKSLRESATRRKPVQQDKKEKEGEERKIVVYNPDSKVEKHNIVHIEAGSVETLFYKKIRENGIACNKRLYSDENGVSAFMDEHDNYHFQNETHYLVQEVLAAIVKKCPKFPYKNSLVLATKLGWTLFNYLVDRDKLQGFKAGRSYMNAQVAELFTTKSRWFAMSAKKGWYEPIENQANVLGVDDNKHYTSCVLSAKMGWSVFNIMDDVIPYEEGNDITEGFYYVETDDTTLFAGNDWYCEERVLLGLKDNIITQQQIKYEITAQEKLPNTFFEPIVKQMYDICGDNAKTMFNGALGYLGRWKKTTNKHFFTQSVETVLSELSKNENVTSTPIYRKDLEPRYVPLKCDCEDECDCDLYFQVKRALKEGNPNRDDLIAFHLRFTDAAVFDSNYLPIHKKIYDLSAIKMYKLRKQLGGKLVYQNCDTLVVEYKDGEKQFTKFGTNIGDARKLQQLPEWTGALLAKNAFRNENRYVLQAPQWVKLKPVETDAEVAALITERKSMWLYGEGGTGKSYLIRRMHKYMNDNGIIYKTCAPTAVAAALVNGTTMHELLGLSPEQEDGGFIRTMLDKLASQGLTYIFVDEASMVDVPMMQELLFVKARYPQIHFIVAGDLDCQLPPPNDRHYPEDMRVQYAFMHLCDFRQMQLTKNWRLAEGENGVFADPEAAELILNLRAIRQSKTRMQTKKALNGFVEKYGKEEHPLAICWTNSVVDFLNKRWNEKFAKETKERVVQVGDMKLWKGIEVLCRKNLRLEGGKRVANGERLHVESVNTKNVTLVNAANQELKLDLDDFRSKFKLAYAFTCHAAQGQTFTRPYTIYEADQYKGEDLRRWVYTAMSRASDKKLINFASVKAAGILRYYIYKIVHRATGKVYVGQTLRKISKRMLEHFDEESTSAIALDVKTYGADAFDVVELEHAAAGSRADVFEREQYWINRYDSVKKGYNRLRAKKQE